MPVKDYKAEEHYCSQEARLVAIETKLENKKEHIHELDSDYYHLRDKMDMINLNLTEITALMKLQQEKEKEKEESIDAQIKELQAQLTSACMQIEKTNASIDTLKYLIPIACTILTFIINYFVH